MVELKAADMRFPSKHWPDLDLLGSGKVVVRTTFPEAQGTAEEGGPGAYQECLSQFFTSKPMCLSPLLYLAMQAFKNTHFKKIF